MDLILNHGVEYDVDKPVAVEDLVRSIQAHAKLMRTSLGLISDIVPGLTFQPKYVSVSLLSQQSPLKEMFAFAVVVSYQDALEEEVPALVERLTGMPMSDEYDTLVTVLVMIVAIYGISKAFDALFPGRSKASLDETKTSLLSRAAKISGVAVDRIAAAVEVLVTGKSQRAVVSASQSVFAPARNHDGVAIKDGRGAVLVSERAVRDAQAAAGLPIDFADDHEKATHPPSFHQGVRIVLHAMDKDRKKLGWAGHCPDLFDKRIPMHLEKSVLPASIFGKDEIVGDILLTMEESDDGEMEPKEFLLVRPHL